MIPTIAKQSPASIPGRLPPADSGIAEGRMYAIAFDMDIESLKSAYGDPYNNAYSEIMKVLQEQRVLRRREHQRCDVRAGSDRFVQTPAMVRSIRSGYSDVANRRAE
jgi:hypothetical protein